MGERHQAFLVVKIVPHEGTKAKYRCIAAMHHQSCYGRLPLRAVRRFLTLMKKPLHQKIIREELRALDNHYGGWRQTPKIPGNPCPYSSFLLSVSFNIDCSEDIEDAYVSGLGIRPTMLHADMGSFQGDNNTGISVIDVTNPEDPAYCFVRSYSPLSANEYLCVDSSLSKGEHNERYTADIAVAGSLEGERLIGLEVLAEAWPGEYQRRLAMQKKDDDNRDQATGGDDLATSTLISRLSDLTLKPAVDHAITSGDTKDIEQLLWLPGKAEATLAVLKQHSPFPDGAITLLAQVLKQLDSTHVDLSGFSLSGEQLGSLQILGAFDNLEALDLSHNQLLTVNSVRTILESTPTLRHLVLLHSPVSDNDLSSLFRDFPKLFYNLHSLTHPLLLTSKSHIPNAFAIIVPNASNCQLSVASVPFFTPTFLVQALTDYLRTCRGSLFFSYEVANSMLPNAVLSSASRMEPSQTWSTRLVPMVASRSGESAVSGEGWIFGVNSESAYGFFQVQAPGAATAVEESPLDTTSTSSETATGTEQQQEPAQARGRAPSRFSAMLPERHKLTRIDKVLDFSEFLTHLTSEGRTPAPEPAVETLFAVLAELQARDWYNFPLMDLEKANAFLDEYHHTGMFHTTFYKCANPYTLIDTAEGRADYISVLEAAFREEAKPVNPNVPDVSDIIISHWHSDHVGGLPSVLDLLRKLWIERNPTLPYQPPRLHKFPTSPGDVQKAHESHYTLPSILTNLSTSLYTPASSGNPLHDLRDSQVLLPTGLRVLHTPGHTTDSIALHIPQDKALYTADTVLGQGTSVFEDLSSYLVSLKKMLDFNDGEGYTSLYPGHGPVVVKGKELISGYIHHRLEREAQILKVLRTPPPPAGPDGSSANTYWTTWTIVTTLYAAYPESLWLPAAHGVDLHLKKLEKDGVVRRLSGELQHTNWELVDVLPSATPVDRSSSL
ncbi:hypothetical protein H0H93_009603 [Arthromyces matolae]|nr:hypothetical protein H0H93_009603 [Arthromyces matolae]